MLNRFVSRAIAVAAAAMLVASPALAQVRTVDPNEAAKADLAPLAVNSDPYTPPADTTAAPADAQPSDASPVYDAAEPATGADSTGPYDVADPAAASAAPADASAATTTVTAQRATYRRDDLIGAAQGVFGKGAEGLAGIIENILAEQGEPNAYIAGREASGAFGVGVRYGSGTLNHTVEGDRPVYWTGPSIGFDVGGDAASTFVLVYNLYDSQDLYRRYPQAEGRAYFVGGFSATYLRRGDVVLIPIRLGVGVRLGANVGYMKFSEKSRWLPF